MNSLSRIACLAVNSWREAIRHRIVYIFAILAILLLSGTHLLGEFDFGRERLRFMADFGFGVVVFFGALLAVAVPAQLFHGEIEQRTILNLLVRPMRRPEYVVGKLAGSSMLLALFVFPLVFLILIQLLWSASTMRANYPLSGGTQFDVSFWHVATFAYLQWLKLTLLSSLTIFIASFAHSLLYTLIVSSIAFLICNFQHLAAEQWTQVSSPVLRWATFAVAALFPNLDVFNISEWGSLTGLPDGPLVARITLYAGLYILMYTSLAGVFFQKREL